MAALTEQAREELRYAVELLEHPSMAARLCDLAGAPLEELIRRLPQPIRDAIQPATHKALDGAFNIALSTLDRYGKPSQPKDMLHKLMASATGCIGGAMGTPGLLVELPITTTLMMRSIAAIARSEGENLALVDSRLACLEVFALGGNANTGDDHADAGYLAVRAALAKSVGEAASYLTSVVTVDSSAPVLVRLISAIAARFGIVVSQKAAAQLVPVVGGLGGAIINSIFMDHFQNMAHGHFIVRRLERDFGQALVREEYARLRKEIAGS